MTKGLPLPQDDAAKNDPYNILLGTSLATQLGITMEQHDVSVEINGTPVHVSGLVADTPSQSVLATTVFMSADTASLFGILPTQRIMHIAVDEGTAADVAALLPIALLPSDPESVSGRP